jgi:short-subunit dehydrogenase
VARLGGAGDFARDDDQAAELKLINLNIIGAVHLAKLVPTGMVALDPGGMLRTSSTAAARPCPHHATWAASKTFLLSLAETLRYDLRDTGVTVTALMPAPGRH